MKPNFSKIKCLIIGGSAGSLQVISYLLAHLRPKIDFPIIIVLHRKNHFDSNLADVIGSRSALTVKEADDKELLIAGQVYIAPAGYHLLLEKDETISLDSSEKVNYSRLSIDVTLESAVDVFGAALAAVLLSGANQDGREGFRLIKRHHGLLIVQDPS